MLWRCPHCGVQQPEASRCWVCRRSTIGCGTCRNYQRGIAVNLGICGADSQHPAVAADELRSCWEGRDGRPTLVPGGPEAIRPSLPMAVPMWLDES